MSFENTPLKAIYGTLFSSVGGAMLPWNDPADYPVPPGNPPPTPIPKEYTWVVTVEISPQTHSSNITREPGVYNGQDITVGMWMANSNTGQAWSIISISSKSTTSVTMTIQDVYRYNTFKDASQQGAGGPSLGGYIIFNTSANGLPTIDPLPAEGVSPQFGLNLQSRFEYINLQNDYPLYAENNTFVFGDVIAADPVNHTFALSDENHRTVIGRITSISDINPGWFTLNPVTKIVDNLDYLPGQVGDTLYASTTNPGEITVEPGGAAVYVHLRSNTQTKTSSSLPGPTIPGSTFQINSVDVTVNGTGTAANLIAAANLFTDETGVVASSAPYPTAVTTNAVLLSPTYGEVVLFAASNPASASINGVTVVFDITSTSPGYENYATAPEMAESINAAAIPGITASANTGLLTLNSAGGSAITIINLVPDVSGVPFAGTESGSGLALSTPASTDFKIDFIAVDARAINFLDVEGTITVDFGLTSAENGIKAAGLYIAEGLRQGSTTVVLDLAQLTALTPLVGDQAYVMDSVDATGNNAGEWSLWLYDGIEWVQTSNLDSSTTDAKSLNYALTTSSPASIEIGKISTGRRVSLITIEVTTPFDGAAVLAIGYQVNNPTPPPPEPSGLMTNGLIDLTVVGVYTTVTDILFGVDTAQGDVSITADFINGGSVSGQAQIIVSYV